MRLIAEDKVIEAYFLLQKFPDFIQQNFNYYSYKEKPATNILDGLGQCVYSIIKTHKERGYNYDVEPRELGRYSNVFEEKFKTFKDYVEVVKFKESLETDINEKTSKSPQRKL